MGSIHIISSFRDQFSYAPVYTDVGRHDISPFRGQFLYAELYAINVGSPQTDKENKLQVVAHRSSSLDGATLEIHVC